jgi:precorrin-3B C17-methyltransferase
MKKFMISALSAGASLLGAPLPHDFAVISLSDLLTLWEKIEEGIKAAAK